MAVNNSKKVYEFKLQNFCNNHTAFSIQFITFAQN
ncbi:hypothetical protein ZPR_1741 [Zunongwangia profunda SM-A87]|uniref:Uncharacterized protein n=1 Tax=Zunongwangia profunda (strain DSM 18752 / CCTCC AB 206139 / SM-A87) TaxID=655815 RepID=D5BLV9_ZUNPS|nr:hypothetical protein ZPR_1741 [Zunongwangia profunda SM-A87]